MASNSSVRAAIDLTIDGRSFSGDAATAHEAVGEHFRIEVRVPGQHDKPADFIGKECTLKLTTQSGATMSIGAIVRRVRTNYGAGGQTLDVELCPALEALTEGQNSRVYLAKTAVDIAKDIIVTQGGFKADDYTAPTAGDAREYTTQYREDDWSFVDRIMREEGVFWFYDHADTTKLVFLNDSTKAESLGEAFPHRVEHGDAAVDLRWVSSLSLRTLTRTTKYTTKDRDPLKPALDLKKSDGDGDLEVYAWPARAIVEAKVTKRAKTALEELRADRVVVHGEGRSMEIRCGKLMTISEGTTTLPFTELFITSLDWTMNGSGAFTVAFDGIPKTTPYRLPAKPLARAPLGPETAVVRGPDGEEIQVDEHGSAYTQPIWDRATDKTEKSTIPQRVGQLALARSMALPRIGWTTLVGHYDDDMDRPWVMARLVDGKHPPVYKLPDNMTRTSWQTLTSPKATEHAFTEIVFEDKGGAEQIVVHAAKDMTVEIGDNEARTIGNRHVLEVKGDRATTIDADDKLTVTKDQTTTVKGKEETTIEGHRSITVKGKEEAEVTGGRTETVKADRTIDVGGNRTLKVTATMTASSKKAWTREILGKHTVTAAATWDTQADGGLTFTAKGDGEETVGAARTSNGKNGVQTLVKGKLTDTVAAAHTVVAKGSAGESSKGKMKLTVGAALTAVAPEIEISAESEIAIACGGATITIKSSEVSVKAPMLAITGPMVVLDGAQVKHNP
jgi:type VI secretion system secreted protein VgrG